MPEPAVSVIICLHNGARYIEETLQSVFAQTFEDFEIVLLDDGSTDGGAELVSARFSDPRLRMVRQPRQTLRLSRPAAVSRAAGEFAAFIDQDDLWLPGKLSMQIEAARCDPGAAVVFSDCAYIDGDGREIGRLSNQYDLTSLNLEAEAAELELLSRGCFIAMSTALVRLDALRRAGGFDPRYQYVNDYDLWLRLSRRHRLCCVPEPLAKYRVHGAQFTAAHPETALAEHNALLWPVLRTASYPLAVRRAVRDNLFGQHRVTVPLLLSQRKWSAAARAAAMMLRFPAGIRDAAFHRTAGTPLRPLLRLARWAAVRPARMCRRLLDERRLGRAADVWIDGTPLGGDQTGYFSLVTELIRHVARRPEQFTAHVVTDTAGRTALLQRLARDAHSIRFHAAGRWTHWQQAPRKRARIQPCIEVLVWRGRFRWRDSRRIAIVQDLTTRIHPELHTTGNVAEFEAFLAYVQRHATEIATVSQSSRRDIIARTGVCASSVWVLPMPVHPQYAAPVFDRGVLQAHGIDRPYILSVGTIEPRKNLRRLVEAFELVKQDPSREDLLLVLAGPDGWDEGFDTFLVGRGNTGSVRRVGAVPLEHLPSLYHYARAVACASVYEGFGLPVLEAMCCSAIVTASKISSLPEVLGEDGLMFDPYDPEAIAGTLAQALALPDETACAYRRQGRARATRHLERTADRRFPLL